MRVPLVLGRFQPSVSHQVSADGAVAARDDNQRQQEGQDNLHQDQGHIPGMVRIYDSTGLHGELLNVESVSEIQAGGGASTREDPHQNTHQASTSGVPGILGAKGMHDGQVAVYAHARDEEDGSVEVEVQESATEFAGDAAKGPAVAQGVVDRPERERQQEEQVRHTQVQHKRVRHSRPRGAGVAQDAHCQDVGNGAQCGDDAEHGRDGCGHRKRRPIRAGESGRGRRTVHDLGRERSAVEKGRLVWKRHYWTFSRLPGNKSRLELLLIEKTCYSRQLITDHSCSA